MRIAFISKMDGPAPILPGGRTIRDKLGAVAVPVQLPIGAERISAGADLVERAVYYLDGLGAKQAVDDPRGDAGRSGGRQG